MGEGKFVIDITEANRLLDEQRRVIKEVVRRCHLKGKHHHCCDCPVWDDCDAKKILRRTKYAVNR